MKFSLPLAILLASAASISAQTTQRQTLPSRQATTCTECPQTVWYVDASSNAQNPDGTEWAKAFRDIRPALNKASSGDCIWVATGRYRPGGNCATTSCDPTRSYQINESVAIYGGFAGNELCFVNRAGLFKQTIITGDLTACGCMDDTDTLFRISGPAPFGGSLAVLLDGLVMEHATNTTVGSNGGAIECYAADLVVRNCTIRDNQAQFGAGIHAELSTVHVADSVFRRNTALHPDGTHGEGGAIWSLGTVVDVETSLFRSNTANNQGGAIWQFGGKLTVYNSTFRANSSGNKGGVLYIDQTFPSNRARFVNCLAFDNSANQGGVGFIDVDGGGAPVVGGVLPGRAQFTNCTLANNTTTSTGPAFSLGNHIAISVDVTLNNSILWNNTGAFPEIYDPNGFNNVNINSSIVSDNTHGGLVANPLFAGGNNFRVQAGSPAISLGDNTRIRPDVFDFDEDGNTAEDVPWDLDQRPRVQNGTVEAGAYEF